MAKALPATLYKTPSSSSALPPLDLREFELTLVGTSSLIMHAWSEKAKAMIRDKQAKKASKGREVRDPHQEYQDSMYKHPDGGYGFPAVAFKACAVSACSSLPDITKVLARSAFHIECEFVKIDGEPNMREDMVRVGMGAADLRYRGEFKNWSATFTVRYNASVLSEEQIKQLFEIGGFGTGIGEHRPEKDGQFGRFTVKK